MAILLPALSSARESARNTQCLANVRSLAQAYVAWTTDRNYADHPYPDNNPGVSRDNFWIIGLLDYGFSEDQRVCPEATTVDESNEAPAGVWFGTAANGWREARAAATDPIQPWVASYSFNAWMYGSGGPTAVFGTAASPINESKRFGTIDKVASTSETPLFGDGMWRSVWPLETEAAPITIFRPHLLGSGGIRTFASSRHKSKCNLAYADGSAGLTPIENLWSLNWHKEWQPRETVVMPSN